MPRVPGVRVGVGLGQTGPSERRWAAIRPDSSPREKRRSGRRHTEEDDRAGPQRAAAVRKPRRAASEEMSPAGSVTLDL